MLISWQRIDPILFLSASSAPYRNEVTQPWDCISTIRNRLRAFVSILVNLTSAMQTKSVSWLVVEVNSTSNVPHSGMVHDHERSLAVS